MSRTESGKDAALSSRAAEVFSALLLAAAFGLIQTLIGGTRLLFSLPAYGLLAIIGLLALLSLRRSKSPPNQLCLIGSAVFFGYILGRALLSPVDYLARADIYSVLGGLLVYLFVATLFTETKRRMLLLLFLLAAGMIHVFIGAIQFRQGDNFMLIPFLQRVDYGRRASGFYVCPNHLAGLLEVLGAFGMSIVCWSRWPIWSKLLTAYGVGICYLGVVLTASRGGYVSTATSILVFGVLSLALLYKASIRLFWRIGGTALLAAAVIGLATVFLVQKSEFLSVRAQNIFETTNMRVDLWKAAIEQWKLQPYVGTGSGTYLYYGRQFRTERVLPDPVYVHNDYLQLMAEYGLVGVAFFAVFLVWHLQNGWKNFRRLGFRRVAVSSRILSNRMALQLGALTAVAACIVHSFFDFNLHIPANVLLLAFVFGILTNEGTQREMDPALPNRTLVAWRLLLPIMGVIIAVQCFRLLPGEYFTERARTALRDNQPLAAIIFALQGLEREQKNPNLYRYLGSARIELGDEMMQPGARLAFYEAALAAFEKGHALAPRDRAFAVSLGLTYDELGRFAEGEWMFNEALALDPRSIPTRQIYAAHLARWGRGATASPLGNE
ncbi:MAG: O-antigen ligase family protein [Chthoniobacterales bacterium]